MGESIEHYPMKLEEAKNIIGASLLSAARDFVSIGFYLKKIRDDELYLEGGFSSVWEFADKTFGISRSTASRYISANDRFSRRGNSPYLSDEFRDYGKSQLVEMLSLPEEKMEEVSPDMTVREIRELKPKKEVKDEQLPGQMDVTDYLGIIPECAMSHKMETEKTEAAEILHPAEEVAVKEQQDPAEQPELPILRNDNQRKEWLRNYRNWGLWYEDEHIGVRYYKYDFENGARLIVEEYESELPEGRNYISSYMHLIGGSKARYTYHKKYSRHPDSETDMIEFPERHPEGVGGIMNRYDVFDTQEKTQIGHGMTGKEVKKAVGSATINVSSYATANCLISGRYRVEIAYFEPSEKWRERFETSWQQVTEKLRCSGVDLSEISITEGD